MNLIGHTAFWDIYHAVTEHHYIADRKKTLQLKNYKVKRLPMGSGGTGQLVEMSDHYRVQIGYGVSRHNYAEAVIINK